MKCETTQYKINQAKFHLQKLKDSYSQEGDVVEYHLDAYLASCRSVIDYIQRDYLNSIVPKLSSEEKRVISKSHKIKTEHVQKDKINKFLKDLWDDFTKFKNSDSMRCYLFEKRDIFTHNEYAGSMGGSFTILPDGTKVFDKRVLESWVESLIEESSGKEIIDIGECNLSKAERDSLIQKLTSEDMIQFLDKLMKDTEVFVREMEEKYCKET